MPEALALARAMVEAGTTTVVATPHIDFTWDVAPEQVPIAVAALNASLAREGIALEVVKGGEVAPSRLRELRGPQLEAVTLGNGPYLLVECPHAAAAEGFDTQVLELIHAGRPVVLAH